MIVYLYWREAGISLVHLMAQSREKLYEAINIHIRRICAWSVAILPLKSVWLFHCQNYGTLSPSVFSKHRKGMHFTAHLMLSTCSELTMSQHAIMAAESYLTSMSLKTRIRTYYWVGVALWLVNDTVFRSSRTAQPTEFHIKHGGECSRSIKCSMARLILFRGPSSLGYRRENKTLYIEEIFYHLAIMGWTRSSKGSTNASRMLMEEQFWTPRRIFEVNTVQFLETTGLRIGIG